MHFYTGNPALLVFLVLLVLLPALFSSCGTSKYERAVDYINAGEYQAGIRYYKDRFRDSRDAVVDDFEVHRYVFKLYERLGEMDKCMRYYRRYKNRNRALKYYIDGLFHSFQGLHSTAASLFKKAAKLREDEHVIYFDLGMANIKDGKYFAANMAFHKAIKKGPSFAPSYYELGMLYAFKRRKYDMGALYVKRAIRRYSEFQKEAIADAKITLGRIYQKLGRNRDALLVLEDAMKYDFPKVAYSIDVGAFYYALGDIENARRFWSRAIDLVGLNSHLGRKYFKNYYGSRGGYLDYTGVPMSYFVTESQWEKDRYLFANEEEYFFENPASTEVLNQLKSKKLIGNRYKYEVWTVEHMGFMAVRRGVRRQVQTRGVLGYLDFNSEDREQLYISVNKDSKMFNHQGRRVYRVRDKNSQERRYGGWEREYWYKKDVRLAYFKKGTLMQVLDFPVQHLYRVSLLDIDDDGTPEIIAAGFDTADRLILHVYKQSGSRWITASKLNCTMDNVDNGFVFLNLNFGSELEMVRFSSGIAWADVYEWTASGFVKRNRIFTDFAEDFVDRFKFFRAGYSARGAMSNDLRRERNEMYNLYKRYLPLAKAIDD